jgi:hypothetical protein
MEYVLATVRNKRGKCCMCTCIVSLTAQVQTDEQTEIDMETNMCWADLSEVITWHWVRVERRSRIHFTSCVRVK